MLSFLFLFSTLFAFVFAAYVPNGTQMVSFEMDTIAMDRDLSPFSRLSTRDVTASMFSEKQPVHSSFFGPLRDMVAKPGELEAYVHPRIAFGPDQWEDILSVYTNENTFDQPGTWSGFFRSITQSGGPQSQFILDLASMDTSAYQGLPYADTQEYQSYREGLRDMALQLKTSNAANADTFVICSLWASVALKQQEKGGKPFISVDTKDICIDAAVAWAKIVLAHRSYFCNPDCPTSTDMTNYHHFWDTTRRFDLDQNWLLGGTGIGFTYDLLYDYISPDKRKIMRSAIAMFVMNRFAWGASEFSDVHSPNAILRPHRIFSNWAAYNSNLFLANLAIEKEDGFDEYCADVLAKNGKKSGFNAGLHQRYSALLEAFMTHSFYPDGSTFEDGYSYFIALREGSLGLLASHRRGSNVLGTGRFKNIIHNAAQMYEPWHCGNLMGHASGGGSDYNAHVALFRYAYPSGELPGMLWRQRFGNYEHDAPCRIFWGQAVLQFAFLGGEHSSDAESPATMKPELKRHFKLSCFSPRRGLLIFRSSISEQATYMHFDARPDAFIVGHDNADRGIFTFSALRQTWIDDLPWEENMDSRKHSLLHVDGLAQDLKAPSVKMLKVKDDGAVVLSAADLTYAYNRQWTRGVSGDQAPSGQTTVYTNGVAETHSVEFEEPEPNDPWTLGWPVDDRARDIGFHEGMTLHGEPDLTFSGIYQWRRQYRQAPLSPLHHVVRSAVLVRTAGSDVGYGLIVDSVSAGPSGASDSHDFESYLILHAAVSVASSSACTGRSCKLVLTAGAAHVDMHVFARGTALSYRVETVSASNKRLVVKSTRDKDEEIWLVFHPRANGTGGFVARQDAGGKVTITHGEETRAFRVDGSDHTVVLAGNSGTPAAPASPTRSSAPRPSSAPSALPSSAASAAPSSGPLSPPLPAASAASSAAASSSPGAPTVVAEPSGPTAERSSGPMEPVELSRRMVLPSAEHGLVDDSKAFFHPTTATYQVVFTVRSATKAGQGKVDNFVTCARDTTVETAIAVYDCGDGEEAEENYRRRACELEDESDAAVHRCKGFRTRFKVKLRRKRRYYVAVSMRERDEAPVLSIRHRAAKA